MSFGTPYYYVCSKGHSFYAYKPHKVCAGYVNGKPCDGTLKETTKEKAGL